jgi:hypothetical protein
MKNLLLITAVLLSAFCNAQKCVYNEGANCNFPIAHSQLGAQSGYNYPVFKKEKCIVIYLDGLQVKADSCTKIYKADTTTIEYSNPNRTPSNKDGIYATTLMASIPIIVPDWYLYKIIKKDKKEVQVKDVIQFK